jgi:hypothetical protein
MEQFIAILLILLAIMMLISLIPYNMAEKRGRSKTGWFLFSIFLSPLLAVLILACLGDTDKRRKEKIAEAEEIRLSIERKYKNKN